MDNNIFIEILYSWDKLNDSEKVKILQRFEHQMAEIEGREEREIIYLLPSKKELDALASYDFNRPKELVLFDISSAIKSINSVLHENFHADVRSFVAGKSDLKVDSDIDEARFYNEEQLIDILNSYYANFNFMQIFATCFYEEVLANENTTLRLMKWIYDSVENAKDVVNLASVYTNQIILPHYNYISFISDHNYDSFHAQTVRVANSLAARKYADKVKLIVPGRRIIKSPNELLRKQLERNITTAQNYH